MFQDSHVPVMSGREDTLSITNHARNLFYDIVEDPKFASQDSSVIFEALKTKISFVPFSEYLKRYIYLRAEFREPYDSISVDTYRRIIIDSFREAGVPATFESRTGKISSYAQNWLTQQAVSRDTVLLLGFGLSMNVEDVNYFLTKAIRQQKLNLFSPKELVCRYCYDRRLSYAHACRLFAQAAELPPAEVPMTNAVGIRNAFELVHDDVSLIRLIGRVKAEDTGSVEENPGAAEQFRSLYEEARVYIAQQNASLLVRPGCVELTPANITEADVENVLCASIPKGKNGNLTPAKFSELSELFEGRSFSRQHINAIRTGKTAVSRYDIITMSFLVFLLQHQDYDNRTKRFSGFMNTVDKILERCRLAPVYVANPYECFLLMCILSSDPWDVYNDVIEQSFRKASTNFSEQKS